MSFFSLKLSTTLIIVFLFSCTREVNDYVEVKIPIQPHMFSGTTPYSLVPLSAQESDNKTMPLNIIQNIAPIVAEDDDTDWSVIIPAGYPGTKFSPQADCFFIAVASEDINPLSCSNTTTGREIKFFEVSEPVKVGGTAVVNLIAGRNRTFYLLGMKVNPEGGKCISFSSVDFRRSFVSRPYLVGTTFVPEIRSGVENNVSMSLIRNDAANFARYDTDFPINNFYDVCNLTGRTSTPPPTKFPGTLEVSVKNSVFGSSTYINQCVPFSLNLYDSNNSKLIIPYETAFRIDSLSSIYKDWYDCTSGTPTVTPPTGYSAGHFSAYQKTDIQYWYRASGANPNLGLAGTVSQTHTVSGTTDVLKQIPQAVQTDISTNSAVNLIAIVPSSVKRDTCAPITIALRSHAFANTDAATFSSTGTISLTNISQNAGFPDGDIEFFSTLSDCTSGSSPLNILPSDQALVTPPSSGNYFTIYFKADGFTDNARLLINLSRNTYTPLPAHNANYAIHFVDTGNTADSVAAQIEGPSMIEFPQGKCVGPFRVSPYDPDKKTFEPNIGSASSSLFTILSQFNSSDVAYYVASPSAAPCDATTQLSTTNLNWSNPQQPFGLFYIKFNNFTGSTIERTIKCNPWIFLGDALTKDVYASTAFQMLLLDTATCTGEVNGVKPYTGSGGTSGGGPEVIAIQSSGFVQ